MRVLVIGCGIIGAMVAYELGQVPGIAVTVYDRQPPGQGSTGAALGVLMAGISQKVKGRAMTMRLDSVRRYDTLIPELTATTGLPVAYNRQGLLHLCLGDSPETWQSLVDFRQTQGWHLDILSREQVLAQYPYLAPPALMGAVHSRDDRQVNPQALTQALVQAAQQQGVVFQWGVTVQGFEVDPGGAIPLETLHPCPRVITTAGVQQADWVVIAAGLGSMPLSQVLGMPLALRPVLGQALRLRLPAPLGSSPQPVITGDDTHIVPLDGGDYWVGATVEFTDPAQLECRPQGDPDQLKAVHQQAIALCPALAQGDIVQTWSGLRPRPEGRPAPVIDRFPDHPTVLLATGHYRNGILLAPATAAAIRAMITA